MKLLTPLLKAVGFSYDAVEDRSHRRRRNTVLRSEDAELRAQQRRKLVSNTRDLRRNASWAAWAIRKHIDYTATFTFQCRTGDPVLDRRIEDLMSWYARPQNCDIAGRHSLPRMVRLLEEGRTVDGDVFVMKLSDGRLQAIEGDRIRTPTMDLPTGFKPEQWVHGVKVTPSGRAVAYAVCDRSATGNGFVLKSIVPARHVLHHGFFDRFDQVRGVSPLAAGLATFADVAEASEYALAKMKVSQIFGLKLTRASEDPITEVEGEGEFSDRPPFKFNFQGGPQLLDLEAGDDMAVVESKTPSTEFQAFCDQMIAAALKSIDIPMSFYRENFTNYSGARQALLQYEQSAMAKRADVQQVLNAVTAWRLGLWVDDGVLALPRGVRIGDLKWEWIGAGIPWIAPDKEAKADLMLIEAGLRSRQEICKSRGKDFFEVADQLSAEHEYLAARGLTPTTRVPADVIVEAPEEQN